MSSVASPCLLIVDTATEVVHLALTVGSEVRARTVEGGAQASASTLPAMQALLAEAGLAWADLDAIGFGQGPGAFTGLRTACAITQGLALALDKPVLALDTLMAVAEDARLRHPGLGHACLAPDQALWVLQDARMREIYAAPFTLNADGVWRALAEPQLWPVEHAREQLSGGRVHCAAGSALLAYASELAVPDVADCFDAQARPGGQALATLALQAWQRGEQLDAALALPRYVRDKVAQTTEERSAARLAAEEVKPAP